MTEASGIRFTAPTHEGGRRLLVCGAVDVGAVFPPVGSPPNKWAWRVWLNGRSCASEGQAKSELAAKNAALAAFKSFLIAAGLRVDT